jgi:hypothetical protein
LENGWKANQDVQRTHVSWKDVAVRL